MRFFSILVFTLFCLSHCSATDYEGRGYRQTYAVIVAVADYKNFATDDGDLNFTDDDARKFYEFLTDPQGGKVSRNNVSFLIEQRATKAQILKALREKFQLATADDRVIFYFSGHGLSRYLLPYDVNGLDNALSYQEIKDVFRSSKAGIKLCFLDACKSNSISIRQNNTTSRPRPADRHASEVAIMVSSQSHQNSLEMGHLEQGVFSYFLINGLRGKADVNEDNTVDMLELHNYVYKNVKTYTAGGQVPNTFGRFDRRMPVAILGAWKPQR